MEQWSVGGKIMISGFRKNTNKYKALKVIFTET
jgi:hypothetical protein